MKVLYFHTLVPSLLVSANEAQTPLPPKGQIWMQRFLQASAVVLTISSGRKRLSNSYISRNAYATNSACSCSPDCSSPIRKGSHFERLGKCHRQCSTPDPYDRANSERTRCISEDSSASGPSSGRPIRRTVRQRPTVYSCCSWGTKSLSHLSPHLYRFVFQLLSIALFN